MSLLFSTCEGSWYAQSNWNIGTHRVQQLRYVARCGGAECKPSPIESVVFDIDGTLTPDVMNISGVRPDAARAVQAFADKGYKIF